MHYYETTIKLKNVEIDIDIEYSVTPYHSGDYWNPPEGGEVELSCVHVLKAFGKTADELVSWLPILELQALNHIRENDDLQDAMYFHTLDCV